MLDMCFHNVTEALNETKVHFFYSDIMCRPNGITPESSRTYISSMQLVTKGENLLIVALFTYYFPLPTCIIIDNQVQVLVKIKNTTDVSELCIESHCSQGKFQVTIENESGCSIYDKQHSTNDSSICIPRESDLLSISEECSQTLSLLVKVEGELQYERPLQDIPG